MSTDAEQRILLDALVSYSDACTLPLLTPTCPYYVNENGRASCGEQCRDLATARGAEPRKVRSRQLGGLVLRGRELPVRSVSGEASFDANELFMKQQSLPFPEQSTSALLLGLAEQLQNTIANPGMSNPVLAEEIWGELTRRGLPLERIVRGGLTRQLSAAVGAVVMLQLLSEAGLTTSGHPVSGSLEGAVTGWRPLLEASTVRWEVVGERSAKAALAHTPARVRALWGPVLDESATDEVIERFLANTPAYTHALSRDFHRRVATWFDHLFETDLTAAFAAEAPEDAELFTALPLHRDDMEGRWIWERFTITRLNDWTPSSLVQEWRSDPETVEALCPERVLNERTIDQRHAGDSALAAISDARPRERRYEGIVPSLFITQAEQASRNGSWEQAAQIFASVVKLRPADAEAWNNLGFCQMGGTELETALQSLEHSASLPRGNNPLSIANRTLLLHLLGRDTEALQLSDHLRFVPVDADSTSAVMWKHPSDSGTLEPIDQVGVIAYIQDLRSHISESSCTERMGA